VVCIVGGLGAYVLGNGGAGQFKSPLSMGGASMGDLVTPAFAAGVGDPNAPSGGTQTPPAGEAAKEDEKAADAPAEAPKAESDEDMLAKLENWKNQDPRDLIKAKYEDLENRTTKTYDEDSPDFIPETGRIDPLTRVIDAVPEELRPPRSGDTDENAVTTYAFSQAATSAVDGVAAYLQVYNVVQIGLQKLVTIGGPGQPARTVGEGNSFGFGIGGEGFLIRVTVMVAAVSSDEVTLVISAAPQGTDVTISRTVTYIPGTPSGMGGQNGNRGGGQGGGGGQVGPRG